MNPGNFKVIYFLTPHANVTYTCEKCIINFIYIITKLSEGVLADFSGGGGLSSGIA